MMYIDVPCDLYVIFTACLFIVSTSTKQSMQARWKMRPALLTESIIEVRQIKEALHITPVNWEQIYNKNPSITTKGFYYWYVGGLQHVSVKMGHLQTIKISRTTEKRHTVMGKIPHTLILKTP